jgi:c-di-GMP-binding flagellar brake protein YcgR
VQLGKKLITFVVHDRRGSNLILGTAEKIDIILNAAVIANFVIQPETFLMKSELTATGREILLDISRELFKVQRRDYFRLSFPAGYQATFDFESFNQSPVHHKVALSNLSGGGFGFEFQPDKVPGVKTDVEVFGQLRIGDHYKKKFQGTIRHVRTVGSMGSGIFRAGVQFNGIAPSDREELIQLVLTIHRELFSRFKIG